MLACNCRRAVLSALAVTALAALAGCSASVGTKKLNTGKAEKVIGAGLSKQIGGKVTVSCPKDVEIKKGASFTCDATSADGQKAKVKVTQKDDQGNVTYGIVSTS